MSLVESKIEYEINLPEEYQERLLEASLGGGELAQRAINLINTNLNNATIDCVFRIYKILHEQGESLGQIIQNIKIRRKSYEA